MREGVVESAQAREAAGERDLGDRQDRLGQQLLGQEEPPREQQLDRRNAQLLLHDAPNLPRAELELFGDRLEPRLLVQRALLEALHNQVRDPLRIVHRRASRRQLRPAPQARAEAGLLGFLRRVEEPAVGRLWRLRRADRPAINPGGRDADEEDAVKPPIARGERLVQATMILVHAHTLLPPAATF